MFSNHKGIKLEINNIRTFAKFTNTWKLNNISLNIQWFNEGIANKIRKHFKMNQSKNSNIETYGAQLVHSFKEVC